MSKKRVVLVSVLLLAAALLLAFSRLGGFKLIAGPLEPGKIEEKNEGGYYKFEISRIYAIFAEGESQNEKAAARYAVVPYDGRLLAIRFPERYFDSVDEIISGSGGCLGGGNTEGKYIVVYGSLQNCREDLLSLMNTWIEKNKKALYSLELIEDSSDMEKIRYSKMLLVDTVNGVDETFAAVASIAALLLTAISAALILSGRKKTQTKIKR